ncbi:flagellin [Acutalibacter muris]|uniref:Flagellin n=1 Tax=Acutalibacter muris TaxID=1796620 RepID=A0A1Z2XLP7_9FIRM|nr:flagellin [Acutalibacter muris]ANU53978.1 flagellin [Hungateiclostridiaceae bacterium KB18]ASB39343.1 flagellin [Acutalibacter muris]QQR28632.1 flagellin [Acutalibacter muris]
MRIQHNIMAMNSYRNYNNNTSALSKNLEKLSSGYKINRAGDDAAGLALSEKMRAQITGLDAAYKNTKDATSLIKTAEGALQEVQDMLNRMVYLAEESANGVYDNDVDRHALQSEVDALQTEIERIADSANFNGKKLFSSTANMASGSFIFQIGDTANTYDKLSMATILTKGADLRTLLKDALAINISTVAGASAAIGILKSNVATSAINAISDLRGKLGATQNRLDHTLNNLSVMKENIQDAEATVRDTDVAEEMMSYTKNNILIQSAQAMLAQSNAVPQGVLQLLQ